MQLDLAEHFYSDPRARRAAKMLGWHVDFLAGAMARLWFAALHRVRADNPAGLIEREDAEDATDHPRLVDVCVESKLAIEQPCGRLYFVGTEERAKGLVGRHSSSHAGGVARAQTAVRVSGRFASSAPAADQRSAGEAPAVLDQRPALFSSPPVPFGSGIPGAATAPPLSLAIASSSQLPDPESPPPADVAYGSNGVGGHPRGAADGSEGATGKPRGSRVKAQADLLPSEGVGLAAYLLEAIRTHKPNVKDGSKGWAKDLDLAVRVDHRMPAAIRAVIDFAHRSRETFWRANLLSGAKVREHFDTLEIQARRAGPQVSPGDEWRVVAAEARRRGL